jgi:hypothetical protein
VAAIRVMLGSMPAIIRGILEQTLGTQQDMTLVGNYDAASPAASVSTMVAASRPDVLVVGTQQDEWAAGYLDLFADHPRLHILAIGDDARSAMMHELYVRRWRVAELSPPAIVAAVRAARDLDDTQKLPLPDKAS